MPELDKEYTLGAFFKAYFFSCCGLLAGKLHVFVDSHIMFDMSQTLKVANRVKLIMEKQRGTVQLLLNHSSNPTPESSRFSRPCARQSESMLNLKLL